MPHILKQAYHLKRAREIQAQKSKKKKNNKRRKINEVINKIDESKLDNTLELITKLPELSKEQFSLNEGKLISPYFQNKAQVKRLFNKLDLKTHANMSLSLKQSKLQLASSKIEVKNLAAGLEKIRA
ncbi:hypothetical protein C1645_815954 [Glomus cerebriforme]|uniref:Uncharacterized protein n=1 Tax=Glomus cerebriforme TaxID=658196 RepID=A0A397TCH7_9GLOM|nr:hypothetical protein C1645_815954 [Glomus cerebriforme]